MTKSKIKGLLKNGQCSEESVSTKTCCHEYRNTDMSKITLPEFDDNQADWEDFRDIFIAVVHDSKTMPRYQEDALSQRMFQG